MVSDIYVVIRYSVHIRYIRYTEYSPIRTAILYVICVIAKFYCIPSIRGYASRHFTSVFIRFAVMSRTILIDSDELESSGILVEDTYEEMSLWDSDRRNEY